jgi:hypothetical protein
MGLVPTSTRLTQGLFRLPSKRCAVVLSGPRQLVLLLPPSLLSSHHSELSSPRTPSSATGGVRKKNAQSQRSRSPRSCHQDPFSRSYLLVMSWACAGCARDSAGPTVEHVGSLHAMLVAQSLYRHQPCLFRWLFSSLILLGLLVSPISHQGAHDVPLSTVSIVLNCLCPFRVRAFSNF